MTEDCVYCEKPMPAGSDDEMHAACAIKYRRVLEAPLDTAPRKPKPKATPAKVFNPKHPRSTDPRRVKFREYQRRLHSEGRCVDCRYDVEPERAGKWVCGRCADRRIELRRRRKARKS